MIWTNLHLSPERVSAFLDRVEVSDDESPYRSFADIEFVVEKELEPGWCVCSSCGSPFSSAGFHLCVAPPPPVTWPVTLSRLANILRRLDER